MKLRFFYLFASLLTVALMVSCAKETEDAGIEIMSLTDWEARKDKTGNGGPSGAHHTLNIIGVPQDKTASMTGNNGSRLFVKLDGKSKINLTEGDFGVLDANGTDNDGALFSLPAPGSYEIYVRPLGTPGGKSVMNTCATYDGDEVCSMETVVSMRERGNKKFENVTTELTTIYAFFRDNNGDGVIDELDTERVDIFDEDLEGYFWDYDNDGLKLLQVRFYEL